MMKKRFLLIILSLIICFGAVAINFSVLPSTAATSVEDDKAKLHELEVQRNSYIDQYRNLNQQISEATAGMSEALSNKTKLEMQVTTLQNEIDTTEELIEKYNIHIENTEIKIIELEEKQAQQMESYNEILRFYARQGNKSTLEILFSAENFSDFLTKLDYINFILEYNKNIVKEIEQTTEETRLVRESYTDSLMRQQNYQTELAAAIAENELKQAELAVVIDNWQTVYKQTDSDMKKLQTIEKDIQNQANELARQIEEKQSFTASSSGYVFPFAPGDYSSIRITSAFGNRSDPMRPGKIEFHKGVDFAAPRGTPIHAVAGGVVTLAKFSSSYGNYLIIYHGNGVSTLYAHCDKLLVSEGMTVLQNQVIARVGTTGSSTGNHLHLSFLKNDVYYNPADMLGDAMMKRVTILDNLHKASTY